MPTQHSDVCLTQILTFAQLGFQLPGLDPNFVPCPGFPVPRSAILLADAFVWSLAALPGIAVGKPAAFLRFGLDIHIDLITVAAILGAQFTAVSIGYAIAFWLPINATALATQVIMIGVGLRPARPLQAPRNGDGEVAEQQQQPRGTATEG